VVGVSLCVAAISVGAIAVVRGQSRVADSLNDTAEARLYALSAIELGRYLVYSDPNWRNNRGNGTWINAQPIGRGTCSLSGQNPNGAMNNSPSDPLILTGTGVKGSARQMVQVTLTSSGGAATCLGTSATAGGGITTSAQYKPLGQTIASGADFNASGATIQCDAEAAGAINGLTYLGKKSPNAAPRTLPDATSVFNSYVAAGTRISRGSLPQSSGVAQINNKLLSPSSNPFGGGTDPNGLYIIDCQNQPISISGSRIVGTLVLLNCPASSTISGSVNWTSYVKNYPCLLVQGSIAIQLSSAMLAESTTNFNPPATPYNGRSNTVAQASDTYLSAIQGLVYVSGDVSTSGSNSVSMLMIGGKLASASSSTLALSYDPTFQNNPPPGFTNNQMTVSASSWKQAVGP
jgi:hypothetical protein